MEMKTNSVSLSKFENHYSTDSAISCPHEFYVDCVACVGVSHFGAFWACISLRQ